jgi:hypothetical protein
VSEGPARLEIALFLSTELNFPHSSVLDFKAFNAGDVWRYRTPLPLDSNSQNPVYRNPKFRGARGVRISE